jgi:GT2 family glycosyltransferase
MLITQQLEVSFIVPCFNHLAQTKKMFHTLKATLPETLKYEIILIDDCSTDDTAAWMRSLDTAYVKTIYNSTNVGFARSNNAGFKIAQGTVIGLLNNDLLFETTWLEPMLAILRSPSLNAGIVGNIQLTAADRQLDHAGIYLNLLGQFDHIRRMPIQSSILHMDVLGVTGACCLIKKSLLDRLGGLDEAFVNGCEDIDLCLSLGELNLKCYVATNSVIFHHVSLSRDRVSKQNELNSRALRSKWRTVIKSRVAEHYQALITTSDMSTIGQYFDGQLAKQFLKMPVLASNLLAENVLKREESRWSIALDHCDPNSSKNIKINCFGLYSTKEFSDMIPSARSVISLTGLASLQNFYLCGYSTAELGGDALAVTLSINGIQTKTIEIVAGQGFSVGIDNPIILEDIENYFTFEFEANDRLMPSTLREIVPNIYLSHLVISDRKVAL